MVAALEGVVAEWDYQLAALYSKANVNVDFTGGYGSRAALVNGMAGTNGAPYLNPFGTQSAAGAAYLQANTITGTLQDMESTLSSLTAIAGRQFGSLPGGPMAVALSAEFRKEDNTYTTDVTKARQTSSSGLAGQAPLRTGERDIWAVGLEFNFPVLKNLEIGASVRYDDYSDFGSTTNPKVSVKYTPVKELLLRASYNTGFAAPTLAAVVRAADDDVHRHAVQRPGPVPGRRGEHGRRRRRLARLQPAVPATPGRQHELQPEESTAFSDRLRPPADAASWSFGVDYWDYTVSTNIGALGDTTIFADPAKYANLFVRCSKANPAFGQRPSAPAASRAAIRSPTSSTPT